MKFVIEGDADLLQKLAEVFAFLGIEIVMRNTSKDGVYRGSAVLDDKDLAGRLVAMGEIMATMRPDDFAPKPKARNAKILQLSRFR